MKPLPPLSGPPLPAKRSAMASTSRDSPAQRRPSYTIAGKRGSSGDKA